MGEGAQTTRMAEGHAYPRDLAPFVRERWEDVAQDRSGVASGDPLPEPQVFENLLSTCYQVSLLREEERPIMFRLILAEPERFPPREGPPSGLHRLEFPEPRPFDIEELSQLSPAADFYRSLVGVRLAEERGLEIWGLVHSGPRWLRSFEGGRGASQPLPPSPVLHVTGSGRIEVCKGPLTVAKLDEGRLSSSSRTVYDSKWLPDSFAPVRGELMDLHLAGREEAKEPWAKLDPDVTRKIAQHMVRRLIATMRSSHHGGTVIIVPPDRTEEFSGKNRFIDIKYKFSEGEPRRRYRTLIVGIMNTLAEVYGGDGGSPKTIGWDEYEASGDEALADLEEAIFEMSHLIAGLSAVDGAVVMTQRYELLGFGGEISGALPSVRTVARALDVEGEHVVKESTEGVGTRHRSAYRLCNALLEAIAVVVSQDGSVRWIKWKDGMVTYWDQA